MNGHFDVVDFNHRVWELWRTHPNQRGERIPKFVTEPKPTGGLLYLGLNPSLPKSISQRFVNWMLEVGFIGNLLTDPKTRCRERFLWAASGLEDEYDEAFVALSAKAHHKARHFYPKFFARLNTLARWLGVRVDDYAHADLFFWLEPNSGIMLNQVHNDTQFAEHQMAMAFELLCAWQPRMIVCPYRSAADEFRSFCASRQPKLEFAFTPTDCSKLKVACVRFPWSTELIPVFSCAGLPSSRSGMDNVRFTEAAKIVAARYWPNGEKGSTNEQRTTKLEIVSGGQSGAERAALDWAIGMAVPHSGRCPKGRRAEDGPIPAKYVLEEMPKRGYLQNIEWNVKETDGTVIFSVAATLSGASQRAAEIAGDHKKPCLQLANPVGVELAANRLRHFVERNRIKVLNVTGPSATEESGVGAFVQAVLGAAFGSN